MSYFRFCSDCRGSVVPMLALAALPLFGAVGSTIDFGRAASARAEMQSALDATALFIAKEAKNVDGSQLVANANAYFAANFHNSQVNNLQIAASSSSGSSGYTVSAAATASINTQIMKVMGFSTLSLAVHSSAKSYSDGLGCVLSLDPHASGAATGQGSTAVTLNGCSLYDNSDDTTALVVGGSASVTALSVGVVGNVSGAANISTTQGILTGVGVVQDPYITSSYPAFSGCTQQNFNAKNAVTITPGVYCGGMTINAGANVTLSPGIYYLDGGNLAINGGATLTGSQVTLVFTSQNRNGFATASINGNATINLTPPKTGGTAGIVIFGDRRMPKGTVFKFNGGATQYLGGAIYIPQGAVNFSGGAGTSTSCTQLIADTVTFTGNSNFAINCSNYGTKPFSPLTLKITS